MGLNKMIIEKFLLLIMICFSTSWVKSQTFDEWFKQKKTQIQYLVEQIAALQVYNQSLKEGYNITSTGLEFIHRIKKGDLDLHELYFSSLKKVNPQVKSYTKIAAIILLKTVILNACDKQKKEMKQSRQFSVAEIGYSLKVFENLLDECGKIIDQLTVVLKDGSFEMKDEERIKIVDQLYDQMQDKYVFLQHFRNETNTLGIQRIKDKNDVRILREDFGIY